MLVAAWLVESKQRVVENMAPVLTMLFTPLFAVMPAAAAITSAATGLGDAFDRDLVSVFDALLVVVLALVLYGMSARDPSGTPNWSAGRRRTFPCSPCGLPRWWSSFRHCSASADPPSESVQDLTQEFPRAKEPGCSHA